MKLLLSDGKIDMKTIQKGIADLAEVKIDENMRRHDQDPFVVRKAAQAKRALKNLKK